VEKLPHGLFHILPINWHKGKIMRKPSHKQAITAAIVKESIKQGAPLSRDLLLEAHVEGYGLTPKGDKSARQIASSYVNRNLKSAEFLAEVGLESKRGKTFIDEVLVQNVMGTNPLFPRDKDLHRDAVKIVAGIAHEQKHVHAHAHVMASYAKYTLQELQDMASGKTPIPDADL